MDSSIIAGNIGNDVKNVNNNKPLKPILSLDNSSTATATAATAPVVLTATATTTSLGVKSNPSTSPASLLQQQKRTAITNEITTPSGESSSSPLSSNGSNHTLTSPMTIEAPTNPQQRLSFLNKSDSSQHFQQQQQNGATTARLAATAATAVNMLNEQQQQQQQAQLINGSSASNSLGSSGSGSTSAASMGGAGSGAYNNSNIIGINHLNSQTAAAGKFINNFSLHMYCDIDCACLLWLQVCVCVCLCVCVDLNL